MHCGEKELCYLAQTLLFIGESQIWGSLKIVIFFGGQKENVSNKENSPPPPPIHDFMNERSLKLTKIFNLNLLKFDCQNLPFRHSLASSKLNPFLFPEELKFNLKTISKTMQ